MGADQHESVAMWWRAANFLSAAQLYLMGDPLLREPLTPHSIKPRLLGHWGTVPGLNLLWAHANRVIRERRRPMIYVCGPGHGGNAILANAWLEGTYSELYPHVGRDAVGMAALVRQFSFPGGVPSHAAPSVPGSINEGGELGYSLAHAVGAALDDPELTALCVIGDGEAETATLAGSWQLGRLLHPERDGAVLPVLDLNGWKIANPTVLARIPESDLLALLRGNGWDPLVVSGAAGDEERIHPRLADAFDEATAAIADRASTRRRPMIVLRTPKGWTGPREVDGTPIEGTWRAHQIPLSGVREDPARLEALEEWLRSYRPDELFDDHGRPVAAIDALIPPADLRMSAADRANGGRMRPLDLPSATGHGVEVGPDRRAVAGATPTAGPWLAELLRRNRGRSRLFGPDEVDSNRLDAVFEVTERQWGESIEPGDEHQAVHGQVIELLGENMLQGMAEGYALTGRHPVFTSYEAFIHIVDSMFNQYAKWIESATEVPWRGPLPAFTYLLSSHVWRQDHNGFSHQDPGFMSVVANKRPHLTRIYLPADANTLLAVLERAIPGRDLVNLVIAGKNPQPVWLPLDEAREHVERGIDVWPWASRGAEHPDAVLAAAGDVPTIEAVAAAQLIRERSDLAIRVVNIVDLMRLVVVEEHPHGLDEEGFQRLFPRGIPVVVAFHGYPSLVHQLLHGRPEPDRFHVHGFQERGTTTTPFDMVMMNDLDRYSLAADVLNRVRGRAAADLVTALRLERDRARSHAYEHGVDAPEIEEWKFRVARD